MKLVNPPAMPSVDLTPITARVGTLETGQSAARSRLDALDTTTTLHTQQIANIPAAPNLAPYSKVADVTALTTRVSTNETAILAKADKKWAYKVEASFYHDNTWRIGGIPTLPTGAPINAADGSKHHQVNRDCTLVLIATYGAVEGPGMSIKGQWQVFCGNGNWLQIGTAYDANLGGSFRGSASASAILKSGDYIRFACLISSGGANDYPGNRTVRFHVIEV